MYSRGSACRALTGVADGRLGLTNNGGRVVQPDPLSRYRPWLYAAAVYNLVWSAANVLFPRLYFDLVGMPPLNYPAVWQLVAMLLLVYAGGLPALRFATDTWCS